MFGRLAVPGVDLAANLDPSQFYWPSIDARANRLDSGQRVRYCCAKEVKFIPHDLALNGVADRGWPNPAQTMPWTFATVGQGQGRNAEWWRVFVAAIAWHAAARTVSIEPEDPFVPPAEGVPIAVEVLGNVLRALPPRLAAMA